MVSSQGERSGFSKPFSLISSHILRRAYLAIGADGEMSVHVLVVLGFVDAEMNDVGFLGVLVDFAGNPVVEAALRRKQKVALANRPISGHRSMHSIPIAGLRVVGIEYPQSHEGVGDG